MLKCIHQHRALGVFEFDKNLDFLEQDFSQSFMWLVCSMKLQKEDRVYTISNMRLRKEVFSFLRSTLWY